MPPTDACPYDSLSPPRALATGPRARAHQVRRVFVITLILNIVVAIAKGAYGWVSGSVTLGADAFHSVLDASSNVVALVGMHFAAAPADAGHPYGHRKFEIVAALGIAALVGYGLVEMATEAVRALRGARPAPDIGWGGFAVVLGTFAVNAFVSTYERRQGERLFSPLLLADAGHTRSDMYASGAVLAAFVAARSGVTWADGAGGVFVTVMVGKVAWDLLRQNIPFLVDAAVVEPRQVRELGMQVPGVQDVHQVRSRGTRWAMELDLHMVVAPELPVRKAHALAHELEDHLRVALPFLSDVVVHIEPAPPSPTATRRGV